MPKYMSETEHKILRKLLEVARAHNFAPVWVDDGGDDIEPMTEDNDVVEAVDSVEYSGVRFEDESGIGFAVYVLLGDGTDFISDHTYPVDHEAMIDQVMNEVQDYAESLDA